MTDTFYTLKGLSEGYYMDKGSKFNAYASPVIHESAGMQFLLGLRKEHVKARHHCYAMRLLPDASFERSADDGEPSGSAGKPILGQLTRLNLTNVMLVVVRYFGGTQLGIPGLIEAYKTSAADALEHGVIIKKSVFSKVLISMPYQRHPHFLNYCKVHQVPILLEEFGEYASMTIALKKATMQDELITILGEFSQMDFTSIKDYADFLSFKIDTKREDLIL